MTGLPEIEPWSDADIAATLNRLADEIDPESLGSAIVDAIVDRVPEFEETGDSEPVRTMRMVATRTLEDVWQGVRVAAGQDKLDPPMVAIVWSRELARRGVELHVLLRAYRIGHDVVERAWSIAADELVPDTGLRAQTMERAFRFFFSYVDAVSVQLAQTYLEEHARRARGSAAVREETARRLMSGQRISTAEASAGLGYDISGSHLGFVVWIESDEVDSSRAPGLELVANRVGSGLGRAPHMLISRGQSVIWGWKHQPAAAADLRLDVELPADVRVAIGGPASNLDGWIRTHGEALEARRVAQLLGSASGQIVRHRDVALLGLLTDNPAAAQRFIEVELRALADDNDLADRLRSTLAAYCEENLSPIRTARRLGVNKNTVVYRIEQAEEILGHDVAGRRQELQAAVQLAEIFGRLAPQVASRAE